MKSPEKYVFAKLPNAGLGNMMYIWAKALVFAHLNKAPLYTSSWWRFHIGPYLRRQVNKRWYWGFFNNEPLIKKIHFLWFRLFANSVIEPPIGIYSTPVNGSAVFVMDRLSTMNPIDSFKDLKAHRSFLKTEFEKIITRQIHDRIASAEPSVVGVHIRRGDFKLMGWLLPLDFFYQAIINVRAIHGTDLPVTIFTDGSEEEMQSLLALPSVKMASSNPDIVDLLLLSRSKIMIISTSSTFSNWAAFFSEAPILRHPNNNHAPMRPDDMNNLYYEGVVSDDTANWPALLVKNIKSVRG